MGRDISLGWVTGSCYGSALDEHFETTNRANLIHHKGPWTDLELIEWATPLTGVREVARSRDAHRSHGNSNRTQ